MRIVLVTHDFPPVDGGISRMYAGLAASLRSIGVDITVLAPRSTLVDARRSGDHEYVLRYGPARNVFTGKWKLIHEMLDLHRILASVDADMVVFGHLYLLLLAHIVQRRGLPYTVILHGGEGSSLLANPITASIVEKRLKSARGVVANSHYTMDQWSKMAPGGNFAIVHPGVDPQPFMHPPGRQSKARLGLEGRKVLLTVSRLVPRKGHDTVITALPSIVEAFPEVVYVIVGQGPERRRLETLVSTLDLDSHVRFEGFVPDAILPDYYAIADVFVMPSRLIPRDREGVEGFGITYLEANAAGCPVVAGRSGGVSDAVIDGVTGLLVDPNDAGQVAQAVMTLLRDTELRDRLVRCARERVLREFAWERQAALLLDTFRLWLS